MNLPGKVHSGFLFAFESLAQGIVSAVKALDPNQSLQVYITGHSKGGGMAPIANMYLKNAYNIVATQTITFAGPNPGNQDFCTVYNTENQNDIRYENYLDIVPLMPPTPAAIADIEAIPSLPSFIIDLLNDAKSWDYGTVGGLWYIDSNFNAKYVTPAEEPFLLGVRLAEIGNAITNGNFSAIADAHHAECGYGYMKGTCQGTVCPV